MPFFELRDHENRIREVQLVYREVVPRLFDPPDRWDKAIIAQNGFNRRIFDEFQEAQDNQFLWFLALKFDFFLEHFGGIFEVF